MIARNFEGQPEVVVFSSPRIISTGMFGFKVHFFSGFGTLKNTDMYAINYMSMMH